MSQWSLQDAKNKFSQVVEQARNDEPQIITRRGERAAVVLSYETYLGFLRTRKSIVEMLIPDEPIDFELDIRREPDYGRDVDL